MTTAKQTVGCVKAATDIIGDKWTPHLLRFFFSNEQVRFCQLQDLTGGINPRTLSARLNKLEEANIICKIGAEPRHDYQLTEKGKALLPIIQDMEAWSARFN